MAGKPRPARTSTMADILAEKLARPAPAKMRSVNPGRMNREGNLCTPDGTILSKLEGNCSEEEALAAVRSGAVIAFESYGCDYGCIPEWFRSEDLEDRTEPPRAVRGSAPSWIEIWGSAEDRVVFVHGDFRWANLF